MNSKTRRLLTAVGTMALMSVACGGGDTPDQASTSAGSSSVVPGALTGHNVLLVTLDTLRADRLGAYGYDAAETPNIDRLASEGVLFDRVTTTVPVTLPAHASIMTGNTPLEHGVRNNGAYLLGEDAVTLAEALSFSGYATGGFIGAVVLDSQFGIAQGFDTYGGLAQYQGRTGDFSGERPGEDVVEHASSWLRGQQSPWFAWVHMYDPHDPYEAPEPYGSQFADRPYDGEVAYVDAMMGRLLDMLEVVGAADNTLVIVTSDHGEGLGDHGEEGHSFFIYDSTVRVPMIFWAPSALPAGAVVSGGAGVVDIFPTVLSLLGIEGGQGSGNDLTPRLYDGSTDGAPVYTESLIPYLDFGWSELRAVVDGDYKYIAAPEPELYNLADDPGETNNLVDADVARADAMDAQLAAIVGDDDVTEATGVAVDAESVAALQALGYLAGGGPAADRRDIDPKDMVETYEEFVAGLIEASVATEDGRHGDANDILVRLDTLLPDQYIVHYYFGQLAMQAGDPATAVNVLERALELNPSYLPTYTSLTNALYQAGNPRASLQLIAEADRMFPNNFDLTFQGAAIAHDTGNLDVALQAYRVADRLRPDDPALLERLGHLHLLRQEPEDAVVAMRRLITVTPNNAAAWAQLAVGLAQTGDSQAARDSLQRALDIDPDDPLVQQIAAQFQ